MSEFLGWFSELRWYMQVLFSLSCMIFYSAVFYIPMRIYFCFKGEFEAQKFILNSLPTEFNEDLEGEENDQQGK